MVKLIIKACKAYKKNVKIIFYKFFSIYKNVNRILSKKQRKAFKKAREKYQNLSEEEKDKKLQYAREQYRNLFEEEKEKKCQYGRERYKKLLGNEKERLFEYINNYSIM